MSIEEIFQEGIAQNASDIHLVANQPVYFRVDGQIKSTDKWGTLDGHNILDLVEPIITKEEKEQFLNEKDLDFSYQLENSTRFRINLFWEKGNPSLAARIIPPGIPTMEEINMPPSSYKLIECNQGLVILTGPTGCGKSTTLAAMINQINEMQAKRIITLEDPIEFAFSSKKSVIMQRELGRDMLSFAAALKHVVRQDPNIIMVGEMRDRETIALALTLAETGHLILATLHTPNTIQTIDRIVDVFPSDQQIQIRFQLALSLKGIIAQRLVPRVNGGQIAAREVLINLPSVASLIREHNLAQIESILQTHAKDGMHTLDQDLKKLYKAGKITLETAQKYARNKLV